MVPEPSRRGRQLIGDILPIVLACHALTAVKSTPRGEGRSPAVPLSFNGCPAVAKSVKLGFPGLQLFVEVFMGTTSTLEKQQLLESNVESVASALLLRTLDSDGNGLIELFQLLQDRARDLQGTLEHSARSSKAMLAKEEPVSPDDIQGHILEAVYETRCTKLFLAAVCRKLAEDLESELSKKQSHLPRIKCAQFLEDGHVDTFQLET
jgi:hypothetical protein